MTQELFIRLCWRFGRAFIAGAVGTMVTIIPMTGNSWNDLAVWLSTLALAGAVGGISATIQAIGLYLRN
jgi:hypothetical protein